MPNTAQKILRLALVCCLTNLVAVSVIILFWSQQEGDKYLTTSEMWILTVLLVGVFFTLPTIVMCLVLHYSRILPEALTSIPLQSILTLSVLGANYVIKACVQLLPHQVVFEKTPYYEGKRDIFGEGSIIVYSFALIVLLVSVFSLVRYIVRKTKQPSVIQ
jgi:hypothetical protein